MLMPAATPTQPIRSQREAAAAAAVQDLPGIGTWAGRYRLFGRQEQEEGQAQGAPAAASHRQQRQQQQQLAAGEAEQAPQQQGQGGNGSFGSFVVLRPGGFGGGTQQPGPQAEGRQARGPAYGSEQAQEEAWRWRFSRKWATEQQRYYEGEPGQAASVVSDDLDAMHFTQARAAPGRWLGVREQGCGRALPSAS